MDRISALKFSKEIQQHEFDKIIHDIIMGKSVFFAGGISSGKTTLNLKMLCEMYDKISLLQEKIKAPYAFVINPITFKNLESKLLAIKQPMNISLQERFKGIPIYISPKVLLNICRIAWSKEELEQILKGEK